MTDIPETEETTLADVDVERELLGALLVDNGLFDRVAIKAGDFYRREHRDLWETATEIITRGELASVHVLAAAFPKMKSYIAALPTRPAFGTAEGERARTLRDFAARRRLVEVAAELHESAGNMTKPADEIIADAKTTLSTIPVGKQATSKRQVAERVLASLNKSVAIYPTGLRPLDEAMGGGLMSSMLYGIAARKKVGKTLLLGTISANLNRAGVKHLFICCEMSAEQIERRNIARDRRFNAIKFLTRDMADLEKRVAEYVVNVRNFTLYEHTPGISFGALKGIIGRARLQGIRGVILDYWQLVQGRGSKETEEAHLRAVAQWLADTAVATGLWILTAAQVNQEGNTRSGEGLKLACDQYFTLHRPKGEPGAWLEMEESRYTIYQNVGSETMPGIWLSKIGPHFMDEPPPLADLATGGGAA